MSRWCPERLRLPAWLNTTIGRVARSGLIRLNLFMYGMKSPGRSCPAVTDPVAAGSLAVGCSALGDQLQARTLADQLGLPWLGVVNPRNISDFSILLYADDQGLALQVTGKGAPGPVRAEFVAGKMGYRREHGGGTGQLVARAVGLHKTRARLHVLDATAGLGQDAFVLAGLGCQVTMLERNSVIHALLADGLSRAALSVDCAPDRKSTRLNSSHVRISYAVFCLKKKKTNTET